MHTIHCILVYIETYVVRAIYAFKMYGRIRYIYLTATIFQFNHFSQIYNYGYKLQYINSIITMIRLPFIKMRSKRRIQLYMYTY